MYAQVDNGVPLRHDHNPLVDKHAEKAQVVIDSRARAVTARRNMSFAAIAACLIVALVVMAVGYSVGFHPAESKKTSGYFPGPSSKGVLTLTVRRRDVKLDPGS